MNIESKFVPLFSLFTVCVAGNINYAKSQTPNVVIIFTDDLGYADVGCFGAKGFQTPNLDSFAAEGVRFTDFTVASSVSTPSRAALLTGCYPKRVGVTTVFFPEGPANTKDKANLGLNPKEETIAEMLKEKGYATACVGKWHLGHMAEFMPMKQGFDYFYGLPYSNDMRPENKPEYPPLTLMEDEKIIADVGADQSMLTRNYTEKSIDFIRKNKNKPFFLYLAHSMPHVPLFASEKFKGSSPSGLYGDVIQEIDWSVGQVLQALREEGLDDNTLVIFTSDNGPWLLRQDEAGSALPLRDGKMSVFEGGYRVPCIIRYPPLLPKGRTSGAMISSIDILPTIAELTNAELPDLKIDGKSLVPLFKDKELDYIVHDTLYYFLWDKLMAVRTGDWKLILPHEGTNLIQDENGRAVCNQVKVPLSLFNLKNDISERNNLIDKDTIIAKQLYQKAIVFDKILNTEIRPCGHAAESDETSIHQRTQEVMNKNMDVYLR